ncbi:UNVERIFIED_CONTAM: hypothetical protein K2H54_062560 [Gekko kuhli]
MWGFMQCPFSVQLRPTVNTINYRCCYRTQKPFFFCSGMFIHPPIKYRQTPETRFHTSPPPPPSIHKRGRGGGRSSSVCSDFFPLKWQPSFLPLPKYSDRMA